MTILRPIETKATFRAAYTVPAFGNCGVGVRLTTPEQSHLSDAELMASAVTFAGDIGLDADAIETITIGDWTE